MIKTRIVEIDSGSCRTGCHLCRNKVKQFPKPSITQFKTLKRTWSKWEHITSGYQGYEYQYGVRSYSSTHTKCTVCGIETNYNYKEDM